MDSKWMPRALIQGSYYSSDIDRGLLTSRCHLNCVQKSLTVIYKCLIMFIWGYLGFIQCAVSCCGGDFAKLKSLNQSSSLDICKRHCFVVSVGTWQLWKSCDKKVAKMVKYSVGLQQLRLNKSIKFVHISLIWISESDLLWVLSYWWYKQDKDTKQMQCCWRTPIWLESIHKVHDSNRKTHGY